MPDFRASIQTNKFPIKGLTPEQVTAFPASPSEGQIIHRTDLKKGYQYLNGVWQQTDNQGVEFTANKGIANGYAGLDGTSAVPIANLPTGTSGTQVALGNHTHALSSLSDAAIASPATAQVLRWNGTKWANAALATADVTGLDTALSGKLSSTTPLNSVSAPTAPVSFAGFNLTNLADPVNPQDAASKNYVDAVAQGLKVHDAVRAATTTTSGTYNATGGASGRGQLTGMQNQVDAISLNAGDRVLFITTGNAMGGVWTVTTVGTGSNGVWDRATDFDNESKAKPGSFIFVEQGSFFVGSGYVLSGYEGTFVLGGSSGTPQYWYQFSGAGEITATNGISKSSNTLSAVGTTNRISISASGIDISANYVGQTSITTLGTVTTGTWNASPVGVAYGGTGSTTAPAARTALGVMGIYSGAVPAAAASAWTSNINHNLGGSAFPIVQVWEQSTKLKVELDTQVIDQNNLQLKSDAPITAGQYMVTILAGI